jgi:hypothetical protein
MNKYFELTPEQQILVITQVANKTGLPVQAIEKDLWVTTMLQVVFALPLAEHLIFKGGTSLSKVWNVIQRFSEDIDLAINPSIWGFEGDLTKKQVKRLRKLSSVFVRDEFCQALKEAVAQFGLDKYLSIETDPDGEGDNTYPEPRVVHIKYHSLFDTVPYLHSEVKLEIGARSLLEPTAKAKVKSIIQGTVPIETSIVDIEIPTAVAEKTFLEKAFLLHELFSVEEGRYANRKSRHLYDLAMMMKTDIASKAIADDDLWNTIHHHRETLTSMKGVDYTPDIRSRICLIPPTSIIKSWQDDYNDMRLAMIYGTAPTFEELILEMKVLENQFK